MHIVDGALSAPVLITGAAIGAAGVAAGLRAMDPERNPRIVPQVGLLSAAFFIASLIHVPIGPGSVHLILGGLVGLVLGWAAFPAILVALILQAVFFGFGGITVLGVNLANIALPAVIVHYLCRNGIRAAVPGTAALWGVVAGALAIALTSVSVALSLALSGGEFIPVAKLVVLAHVPVMAVEGAVVGAAVLLVRKVRPDLFELFTPRPADAE